MDERDVRREHEERRAAADERMHNRDATLPEKLLAGLSGAAEGFAEESRAGRLPEAVGAAVDRTREARLVLGGFAGGAEAPATAPGPLESPAHVGRADRATERVSELADAVSTAADRASRAAASVAHEARSTARDASRRGRRALGFYALAGALAVATFALLTAALAGVLDAGLGYPWGTVVVAIAYGIVAAVAYAAAGRMVDRAKSRVRRGMAAAREEARSIGRPLGRVGRPGA